MDERIKALTGRFQRRIEVEASERYKELKAQASTYGDLMELVGREKKSLRWNYERLGIELGDCIYESLKSDLANLLIQPEEQKTAEPGYEEGAIRLSKERTVEILERLMEAIRETFNNCKNFEKQMEIAGKMIGISQTLLGYYDRETEPISDHIAEVLGQLDAAAADAAIMEPQAADRLCSALAKLEKRLDAIENIMKRMPEIYAAVFFRAYEEYQAAKLQGKRVSDIWRIDPPNLR